MDYLNINQAARLTGLSIPTIRAKLAKNLLPGATQYPEGKRMLWRIPRTDLIAAGLLAGNKVKKAFPESEKEPTPAELAAFRSRALEVQIARLEGDVRHAHDLHEITKVRLEASIFAHEQTKAHHESTKLELEEFKLRERDSRLVLETKLAQEARRSLWQRFTNS